MRRLFRVSLILPLLVLGTDLTAAEQTPPAIAANPAKTEQEPTRSPAKPRRERPVSDGVASALAAAMPKYNPPPKPNPEDEDVDARDVDKPRNGIIRLPKMTVQEKKPPVFTERDIHTKSGLADLARRRYITRLDLALNRFYIPFFSSSPEQRALAMYAEDERLNNISDMKDVADTISRSDPAEGAYIKRVTDQTYMRSGGFGYESGPGARH